MWTDLCSCLAPPEHREGRPGPGAGGLGEVGHGQSEAERGATDQSEADRGDNKQYLWQSKIYLTYCNQDRLKMVCLGSLPTNKNYELWPSASTFLPLKINYK